MRPGSRNSAFTLIEVAVYCTVLLFLMAGVFTVVEGGARYFRLAQAQETVNQQALIAVQRISTELANTTQNPIILSDVPQPHIIFLSAYPSGKDTYDFAGPEVLWQKWVCFYLQGDKILRAELAITPETDPAAVPVPDFSTDILPLDARMAAHRISDLEFTALANAVYEIRVVAEERTASDKTTNMEMISSVRITNS